MPQFLVSAVTPLQGLAANSAKLSAASYEDELSRSLERCRALSSQVQEAEGRCTALELQVVRVGGKRGEVRIRVTTTRHGVHVLASQHHSEFCWPLRDSLIKPSCPHILH